MIICIFHFLPYVLAMRYWAGVPNDIDAAIRIKNSYYFFKGCYSYVYSIKAKKVTHKYLTSKWNAPCDINTAFTVGKRTGLHDSIHIYLLKGNEYWEWSLHQGSQWKYDGGNKNVETKFGVAGPFDAIFQWVKNGVYYFFKGESYWGLINGKLVGHGSIAAWRGLVDSGRELLSECPCSCTRAEHNEYWSFKGIKYDFKNAVVKRMQQGKARGIMENDLLGVGNCQSECAVKSTAIELVNTKKEAFTSTTTLGLKIGTSFKVGIPSIAEVGIETELSVAQSFTFGKEKEYSESVSSEFTCPGYPRRYTVCVINRHTSTMDVPYTMTLKHKRKGCVCPSKGIFHKENIGWLDMKIERFSSEQDAKRFLAQKEMNKAAQ